MARRMPGASFVSSFILFFRTHFRPRATKSKVPGEEVPITTRPADTPFLSPSGSTLPLKPAQYGSQCYYDLARRLRQLLPPTLNWLSSDDVRIIDATPFSSGTSSEVWNGLLQDKPVAVKSHRCYSSTESEPAEVGLVSLHQSARLLGHH